MKADSKAKKKRAVASHGGAPVAQSLHQRILSDIQGNILSGRWEPGRRIPVELELMEQYGCSRMTVSKVLTQLAHAGIIERRRKSGSFVCQPHSQSAVLSIPDIKTEVETLGLPYRFEVLERHKRRATRDDRALLSTEEAVPVLELVCRHFAKDQPFCLEYRLINLKAVAGAAAESFTEKSPGAWLLQQVPWSMARHLISSVGADREVAEHLEVKSGSPCLVIERTTRNLLEPITFVRLTYPGNLHQLVATFTSLTSQSPASAKAPGPA